MNNVAIVVVTYNRKKMLLDNIKSILNQHYKKYDLFIIDNASTDGTKEYIEKIIAKDNIYYINTGSNLGGAGGFNYGIKVVSEKRKYKYCWIMDDDTIPEPYALKSLIEKSKQLNDDFSFMNSVVKWINGELCLMNKPKISDDWLNDYELIKNQKLIRLNNCSFVSCFINMDLIYKVGLPIKNFFIYYDDVEYTIRLEKEKKAYLDLDSIVIHKMKDNSTVDVVTVDSQRINRVFYSFRNEFYINKKDSFKSVVKYILRYFWMIFKVMFRSKNYKLKRICSMTKGMFLGIFFNPKIEYIKEKK